MKLTLDGIKDRGAWEKAGISVPGYDIAAAQQMGRDEPVWIHFGAGNIFRTFIGSIADGLLEKGLLDRGIVCVETYDYEIVDRIYTPYDNLGINVILNPDGSRDERIIGSIAGAIKAQYTQPEEWEKLKRAFSSPELQLVSFTITEKGYALTGGDGSYYKNIALDIENGPDKCASAMAVLTAGLYARFLSCKKPVALVSMDNCASNGKLIKNAICRICGEWSSRGYVPGEFVRWIEDENNVACDSTMIDKITPRPADNIARSLADAGIEDMEPVITAKRTYIAPYVNAERPQYLVIEDRFPNGRPALEQGFGVYMGNIDTVTKAERMKVTACLNPGHTAVGPLGVVLGWESYADMVNSVPAMMKLLKTVLYDEGLKVAPNPGIFDPKSFTDEVVERVTNPYLGDVNLRLATDATQGFAVRFGETVKSYCRLHGTASELTGIPLGIAGNFRYLMGIDDNGKPYELAPDPLAPEIHEALGTVILGRPETVTNQLKKYLSDESLFGVDLYKAGIGEKIEEMFREMVSSPGAALKTVMKYMA